MLLFSKFSFQGRVWTEFGTPIFFSLSRPITSRLARNNAEKRFFDFLNYFAIFFGIFLPRSVMNGIRDEIVFVSFLDYLIPFGLEIMPEIGFLIFWIFLLFFSEFSSTGRVWTEFEPKLFCRFLGLSYPVWAKNNAGTRVFNFLNFFAILFRIFFCGSSMNGIGN